MEVSLSALRGGRLLYTMNIPGTHFCYRLSKLRCHAAAGKIRQIEKNSMTSAGIEYATFRLVE
jgi:hypothetical protein